MPICPYCQKEIKSIEWATVKISTTKAVQVYFCPHCHKVLPAIEIDCV